MLRRQRIHALLKAAAQTRDKGVASPVVSYSGNRYAVRAGQAAGASTNAPSGTTADNTWWLYLTAGAADPAFNIPSWTNGVSVREGGCYYGDNANARNTFVGCYSEGGEAPAQGVAPTLFVGGLWGTRDPVTTGNYVSGDRIVAPSPNGAALGQTRVSYNTNASRILSVHNSAANAALAYATITLEQGVEADGITPMAVARIRAASNTNSAATAEGVIYWGTRTYAGGGAYTDWLELNGPNLRFAPLADNQLDLGATVARWKTGYFYTLNATAAVTSAGSITSTGGGIGYATGAGGAVTQTTTKSTGVTINKCCGQIATNNAALAASTSVEFTVSNNQVAATDNIDVTLAYGGAGVSSYIYWVSAVAAGSFKITVYNRSGVTKSESLVFNFAVLKAVAA